MKTWDTIKELERERKALTSQLEAIDLALEGLNQYRTLSNGAGTVPRTPEQAKGGNSRKRKRPAQPKVQCPDCGQMYRKGAGMSQHRMSTHGWAKDSGIDLYADRMPERMMPV